jgi:hypothetical protein
MNYKSSLGHDFVPISLDTPRGVKKVFIALIFRYSHAEPMKYLRYTFGTQ